MSWIATIAPGQAEGALADLYSRVAADDGQIDNILRAHSLRPHTLVGHMALYKNVLHHPRNHLSKAFLEAIGVHVSLLNDCLYCVAHHSEGLRRQVGDSDRADMMLAALRRGSPAEAFDEQECALLAYAEKLTRRPAEIDRQDIEVLRTAGVDDGEILEVNQVAAYFAYANRTVLGLGVETGGEALGYSPSSDESGDWVHR